MANILSSFKHKNWTNIFVIYLRYLIGGAFVFSAIPKVLGERFITSNCEQAPINTLPHLFETLYRSGIYWEFLGWSQIIAAFLLMTQLFATLGAIVFFPIILNVFVISITYELGFGLPIITSLILLANIFLLVLRGKIETANYQKRQKRHNSLINNNLKTISCFSWKIQTAKK